MPASPGEILEGKVAKLLKYGAIVELEGGESGLVHISEIADEYVKDVADYLREGDGVTVKVLARKEPGRFELSIKQASATTSSSSAPPPRRRPPDEDFERRLGDFMKRSNQLQNERRKGRDSRRRG